MFTELFCCNNVNPMGITEPIFSWKVSDCEEKKQTAYQIIVQNTDNDIVWDSGKVNTDKSVYVKYDGIQLKENTKYFWYVTVFAEKQYMTSKKAYFITGMFDTTSLKWIAPQKDINAPFVYKVFELNNLHEYVTVNVCGLGFFELYINGKKVSEDLMNPVRTDYDDVEYKNLKYPYENITQKSVRYLTYEVSKYLQKGENILGVWLGNGWYRQNSRITEGIFDYGDKLKMFLKLVNSDEIIESDESWNYISSPILYDNIFYGEIYDGRITPDFNNGMPMHRVKAPTGSILPQICPSDRIIRTFSPEYIENGVYDIHACISGFTEIICTGNSGDKVEIYYAEALNEDGTLNFQSTVGYEECDRNQIQKDVYILKGIGEEKYTPRFVWHAFRYFKISAPESVEIKSVKSHYVCTVLGKRTQFNSSNELLNKIYEITLNTGLSNLHGCVPTDCNGRENLGYTCDGHLSAIMMMYNFNAETMYSKWVDDILASQNNKTGFVPHTAPFSGGGGGPAWGSAVAIVPWNLYTQYGNKEVLSKSKDGILKWIKYLVTRKEKGLITHEEEGSWCLGEWCLPSKDLWSEPHLDDIKIPHELVSTVYFIYCIDIYLKLMKILDENPELWIIQEREDAIRVINSTFLCEEYANGEQGSNVFPLYIDIVPDEDKANILESTIKRIKNNDYCFDTGTSGTRFLLDVLDKYGRNDIAIKMMLNTKYPSYGYMIEKGATSVWETWEGTGALNHEGLSSAGAWLFYGLAGIKPNGGYKEFSIKPFFADELDSLAVKLDCEYGEIGLDWERNADGIDVEIRIPFNTLAHIDLNGGCFDLVSGIYKYHVD